MEPSSSVSSVLGVPAVRKFPVELELKRLGLSVFAEQVAGHKGALGTSILRNEAGDRIYKPVAQNEKDFYESLSADAFLRQVTPRYFGTVLVEAESFSQEYLVLENLTAGIARPCVADLKIGTQGHGDDASVHKVLQQKALCAVTSSRKIGFRICGMRHLVDGQMVAHGKPWGAAIRGKEGMHDALRLFLGDGSRLHTSLIPHFLESLVQLLRWFKLQQSYRFYSSSILLIYDPDCIPPEELPAAQVPALACRQHSFPQTPSDVLSCPPGLNPFDHHHNISSSSSSNSINSLSSASISASTPFISKLSSSSTSSPTSETTPLTLPVNSSSASSSIPSFSDSSHMLQCPVRVVMVDFAHTHPSVTVDQSYITGLSELVYLLQAIAAQDTTPSDVFSPVLKHTLSQSATNRSTTAQLHIFSKITFTKPTWCSWCHSFLYGLYMQGYFCECGYAAHPKCRKALANTFAAYCSPTAAVLEIPLRIKSPPPSIVSDLQPIND